MPYYLNNCSRRRVRKFSFVHLLLSYVVEISHIHTYPDLWELASRSIYAASIFEWLESSDRNSKAFWSKRQVVQEAEDQSISPDKSRRRNNIVWPTKAHSVPVPVSNAPAPSHIIILSRCSLPRSSHNSAANFRITHFRLWNHTALVGARSKSARQVGIHGFTEPAQDIDAVHYFWHVIQLGQEQQRALSTPPG